MIERVKDFIRIHDLLKRDEKLLLAVSGGIDSMVLVHILSILKYDICVAHVNYQLRGKESDLDEAHVRKTCEKLGVSIFVKKVDMKKSGESIQMEARRIRYTFFDELIDKNGFDKILTAHHLNDSLETVLLNLSKGAGISGLTGIQAINEKIVRPLSRLSKAEIVEFARTTDGIEWREDASNKESKYQRNLIRNEVIPKLEKINPSLLQTFSLTQERLLGVRELVQEEVEKIRSRHLTTSGIIELNLEWMGSLQKDLMLLSEVLKEFGASYSLSKEIFQSKESGKQFETPTHLINLDRNRLMIKENLDTLSTDTLVSGPGTFHWAGFRIEIAEMAIDQISIKSDSNIAYLDAMKVQYPILVRSWQKGDSFQPLGMASRKKISDFFIDQKIPVISKNDIPIFVQNDQTIWVGRHRIDDKFKVTETTKRVTKISLRHSN